MSSNLNFLLLPAILVTVASENITMNCQFRTEDMPNLGGVIKVCQINSSLDISKRGYFISSSQDTESVKVLEFREVKNLKFFPINLGEKFPNLLKIDAASSGLQIVEPQNFKNMQKLVCLHLSSNEIESLSQGSFDDLQKLAILHLSWNKIEHLDANLFKPLTKLRQLLLSRNRLINLDEHLFASQKNLAWLEVGFNRIKSLNENLLTNLVSLEVLSFAGNQLETLPENLLATLPNLTAVKFDENLLVTLPEKIFTKNRKLRQISLDRNRFEVLSPNIFDNTSRSVVGLEENRCIDANYQNDDLNKIKNDLMEKCQPSETAEKPTNDDQNAA